MNINDLIARFDAHQCDLILRLYVEEIWNITTHDFIEFLDSIDPTFQTYEELVTLYEQGQGKR